MIKKIERNKFTPFFEAMGEIEPDSEFNPSSEDHKWLKKN